MLSIIYVGRRLFVKGVQMAVVELKSNLVLFRGEILVGRQETQKSELFSFDCLL